MLFTGIRDGRTERTATVDASGNLHVAASVAPPNGKDQRVRIFRQYLTTDGTASGTSAMDVDGSATNVDYFVKAQPENDLYIASLSFVIADATQTLSEFANTNAALTNGCRLFYSDTRGEVDIHDALKTNFDFIRLCLGNPAFGDAAGAFRADNVSGTSEGYVPVLNMSAVFGLPFGVPLKVGTEQRITMRIRDDCTAADLFDCIAYGFERLPDG